MTFMSYAQVERDERSDEESEVNDNEKEDEPEGKEVDLNCEQRNETVNSKLTSLANNCVLNNLTNQRNFNSRVRKAR